jgi:hypothetical protein
MRSSQPATRRTPADLESEGRVSAVAVPHTADVIGDIGGTIADSVPAKVGFCIAGVDLRG